MAKSAAPVRGHHDQIGLQFGRRFEDRSGSIAMMHDQFASGVGAEILFYQRMQTREDVLLPLRRRKMRRGRRWFEGKRGYVQHDQLGPVLVGDTRSELQRRYRIGIEIDWAQDIV